MFPGPVRGVQADEWEVKDDKGEQSKQGLQAGALVDRVNLYDVSVSVDDGTRQVKF